MKELLNKQRQEIKGGARKELEEALDRQMDANEERVVREMEGAPKRRGKRLRKE